MSLRNATHSLKWEHFFQPNYCWADSCVPPSPPKIGFLLSITFSEKNPYIQIRREGEIGGSDPQADNTSVQF